MPSNKLITKTQIPMLVFLQNTNKIHVFIALFKDTLKIISLKTYLFSNLHNYKSETFKKTFFTKLTNKKAVKNKITSIVSKYQLIVHRGACFSLIFNKTNAFLGHLWMMICVRDWSFHNFNQL